MAKLVTVGLASVGLPVAAPVSARKDNSADEARLRAAIAETKQARDSAAEALRKADDANAILERSLPREAQVLAETESATELRPDDPRHPKVARPADMPACDAPGADGSIGAYMVNMDDADRQKKEASLNRNEVGSNRGINSFVYHCLGLTRARCSVPASGGSDR